MPIKSEFWGANHAQLQDPVNNFTQLLLGIQSLEGISSLKHGNGDFDAPRPGNGMSISLTR